MKIKQHDDDLNYADAYGLGALRPHANAASDLQEQEQKPERANDKQDFQRCHDNLGVPAMPTKPKLTIQTGARLYAVAQAAAIITMIAMIAIMVIVITTL